jgi:23S rRNA pseudouridine2605 synthase
VERIAKVLAHHGVASRRQAEELIRAGHVTVNGEVLSTPAFLVGPDDLILVNGQPIGPQLPTRLWMFYKPRGVLTTHADPEGRPTLFSLLPKKLPRVISVGRLDMMSEGLILLTTSGTLSRYLELPSSKIPRTYKVRVFGTLKAHQLMILKKGVCIEDVNYGPIDAKIIEQTSSNTWVEMTLYEGKNREIRRIFEFLGYQISRLIRISYGPFHLEDLQPQGLQEVDPLLIRMPKV